MNKDAIIRIWFRLCIRPMCLLGCFSIFSLLSVEPTWSKVRLFVAADVTVTSTTVVTVTFEADDRLMPIRACEATAAAGRFLTTPYEVEEHAWESMDSATFVTGMPELDIGIDRGIPAETWRLKLERFKTTLRINCFGRLMGLGTLDRWSCARACDRHEFRSWMTGTVDPKLRLVTGSDKARHSCSGPTGHVGHDLSHPYRVKVEP